MARQEIKHQQPNWDGPVNDMFKELYDNVTALSDSSTADKMNQNFTLTNGASVDGLGDGLRIFQVKRKDGADIYGVGRVNVKKSAPGADRFKILLPYECFDGDYRDGSWYSWDNVSFQIEQQNSISVIHQLQNDATIWINFHIYHSNNW